MEYVGRASCLGGSEACRAQSSQELRLKERLEPEFEGQALTVYLLNSYSSFKTRLKVGKTELVVCGSKALRRKQSQELGLTGSLRAGRSGLRSIYMANHCLIVLHSKCQNVIFVILTLAPPGDPLTPSLSVPTTPLTVCMLWCESCFPV